MDLKDRIENFFQIKFRLRNFTDITVDSIH